MSPAETATSDALIYEEKNHETERGLELGLSPLTGFASLHLLY